jgi:hypothetical protein
MAVALQEAVREAQVELPARISLPLSFTTEEAQTEPVSVLSGTARSRLAAGGFADGETDVQRQMRLRSPEDRAAGAPDSGVIRPENALSRSILRAIGLLLLVNAAILTVAVLSDRWPIVATGWPIELLMVGLGLCLIMSATYCIWLLIPIGMLLGNGLLLSYTSLTGRWAQWRVLWPLEMWLVLCIVAVTLWLARQSDRARLLSRWLGRALGWMAAVWSLFVAVAATVA